MSVYERWSLAIQALTLLFIASSVLVVWRQLREMAEQTRQLRRTLAISAEASLDAMFVPVTEAYLQHPELRAVFNPLEAPPLELDRHMMLRSSALAEMLADSMERVLELQSDGFEKTTARLQNWIYDSLRASQFFRTWLRTHRSWYAAALLEIADAAERDVTAPPPPARPG